MQVKRIAERSNVWMRGGGGGGILQYIWPLLKPSLKIPFAIKTFVLSIFDWPFYTGFTVFLFFLKVDFVLANSAGTDEMPCFAAFHCLHCLQKYLPV